MQQLFPQPKAYVYRLARCNRFLGRWLKHGEGYPDWCVRFFHRQYAHWSDDAVHEKVVTTQPAISLINVIPIIQQSPCSYFQKQNQYTSLQAQALVKTGKLHHSLYYSAHYCDLLNFIFLSKDGVMVSLV